MHKSLLKISFWKTRPHFNWGGVIFCSTFAPFRVQSWAHEFFRANSNRMSQFEFALLICQTKYLNLQLCLWLWRKCLCTTLHHFSRLYLNQQRHLFITPFLSTIRIVWILCLGDDVYDRYSYYDKITIVSDTVLSLLTLVT